jgi:hypothetical protein
MDVSSTRPPAHAVKSHPPSLQVIAWNNQGTWVKRVGSVSLDVVGFPAVRRLQRAIASPTRRGREGSTLWLSISPPTPLFDNGELPAAAADGGVLLTVGLRTVGLRTVGLLPVLSLAAQPALAAIASPRAR